MGSESVCVCVCVRERGREGGREGVRGRGRGRGRDRPCQDSFALFYEDGLSMTVRYRGHHCTQLRLGVVSPVGRNGRPPTLIRLDQEQRERERERGRGRGREGGGGGGERESLLAAAAKVMSFHGNEGLM